MAASRIIASLELQMQNPPRTKKPKARCSSRALLKASKASQGEQLADATPRRGKRPKSVPADVGAPVASSTEATSYKTIAISPYKSRTEKILGYAKASSSSSPPKRRQLGSSYPSKGSRALMAAAAGRGDDSVPSRAATTASSSEKPRKSCLLLKAAARTAASKSAATTTQTTAPAVTCEVVNCKQDGEGKAAASPLKQENEPSAQVDVVSEEDVVQDAADLATLVEDIRGEVTKLQDLLQQPADNAPEYTSGSNGRDEESLGAVENLLARIDQTFLSDDGESRKRDRGLEVALLAARGEKPTRSRASLTKPTSLFSPPARHLPKEVGENASESTTVGESNVESASEESSGEGDSASAKEPQSDESRNNCTVKHPRNGRLAKIISRVRQGFTRRGNKANPMIDEESSREEEPQNEEPVNNQQVNAESTRVHEVIRRIAEESPGEEYTSDEGEATGEAAGKAFERDATLGDPRVELLVKGAFSADLQERHQLIEEQFRKGERQAIVLNAAFCKWEIVVCIAMERGWVVSRSEEDAPHCNVHWLDVGDSLRSSIYNIKPWQRINHFPGMCKSLGRKCRLARTLARASWKCKKEYDFCPKTWALPEDMHELSARFIKDPGAVYIVKPDGGSQGRGIWLTNDKEKVISCAAQLRTKGEHAVVQKYIPKPMLLDGKKFDLRLYVLLCANPCPGGHGLDLRAFMFRDGLVRLCTKDYEAASDKTFDDMCMHLTNFEVNRFSDDFEMNASMSDFSTGSKRSLQWFFQKIEEDYGAEERQRIWTELCSICVKTIIAAQPTLEGEFDIFYSRDLTAGHMGCRSFEILGFDIMLNSQRKPYLIEVNHLPSFGCCCPVDVDVKRRVISQALDLTCNDLPALDKETYEKVAKKRLPTRFKACPLFDCTEYKDYLRIFPPTEKCPQSLASEYLNIIRTLSGIYKPATCKSSRISVTGWTGLETTNVSYSNQGHIQSPGLRRSASAMMNRIMSTSTTRERSVPAEQKDAEKKDAESITYDRVD